MPAKIAKANNLHYLGACFQVLQTTNAPVANVIDANAQLYGLSQIPDKFQSVAKLVLDRLPKSSRVDCVTDISKYHSIKFFGRKQRGTSKYF